MKAKILIISIFFVFVGFAANAQSHNEQVTVEGTYRPQIKRSERMLKSPEKPDNEFYIPEYKAESKDFNYSYNIEIETMSAMTYKEDYGIESKNNFLKAGIGSCVSPIFLFRHYSDLTKDMSLGVGIKHYSSWLGVKDYKKSSFMNNDFNIMTVNKFRSGQLRSFVDYDYDMYHLRAYEDENSNGRNIHSVNVGTKWISNGSSYRNLYTLLSGDYRATWIMGATSENHVNASAHLAYSDNWLGGKNSEDLQTMATDLEISFNNIFQNQLLVAVNPYFVLNGDFYRIHAGLRLDLKTGDNMGIYPDVLGSIFVLDNNLEFYAKLGGRSKINTFADIMAENPFVTTDFTNCNDFGYEKTRFDFQGGVKTKLTKNIDAHVGVRYRNIKNGVFYFPDPDFYASYTDDTAVYHLEAFDLLFLDYNLVNILADIHWKAMEKLDIAAELSVNKYISFTDKNVGPIPQTPYYTSRYTTPWYKPSFTMTLRGDYQLNDAWKFNASAMILGKRRAMGTDHNKVPLKPALDFQLGVDYQVEEDLTAFVEIHNLINQKYQLYYNYPSLGFEVFAGIKYRF